MTADLHCHSSASDGVLPRGELLECAAQSGVKLLALTDHDTMVNSYSRPDDKVRVIPGCELSGCDRENGRRVHVLCYMPKDTEPLQEHFERMRAARLRSALQMFELTKKLFPELTWDMVMSTVGSAGAVFKQNIMRALISLGHADKYYGELYYKLFATGSGSCFVPIEYAEYGDLLRLVREARGIAVLAHPTVYGTQELAARLVHDGMVDGVELHHPKNKREDIELLEPLCRSKGLLITGGTDFHGLDSEREAALGQYMTDERNTELLFEIYDKK